MNYSNEGAWIKFGLSLDEIVDELMIGSNYSVPKSLFKRCIKQGVTSQQPIWYNLRDWLKEEYSYLWWAVLPVIWLGGAVSCIEYPVDDSFFLELTGQIPLMPNWKLRLQVRTMYRIIVEYLMQTEKSKNSTEMWQEH